MPPRKFDTFEMSCIYNYDKIEYTLGISISPRADPRRHGIFANTTELRSKYENTKNSAPFHRLYFSLAVHGPASGLIGDSSFSGNSRPASWSWTLDMKCARTQAGLER